MMPLEQAKKTMTPKQYNDLHNEGGEGYIPDYIFEAEAVRQKAIFFAEWTPEVTKSRRIAWNDAIRACGNTVTSAQVKKIATQLGFSFFDLKKAVTHYEVSNG